MSAILVTGSSGYLGSRLVRQLSAEHQVISMSRASTNAAGEHLRGDFSSAQDLTLLDRFEIETVVHLAGVKSKGSEEDAFGINLDGSRRLLRYCIDRGIKHFVVASSIAAVGCLSPDFLPRELPMPDHHPCYPADSYGLSKYLMEQTIDFFGRADHSLEFTVFRIGSVKGDDAPPATMEEIAQTSLPFMALGTIAAQDVVDAFALAATTRLGPGVRLLNLVAATSAAPISTADALRKLIDGGTGNLDLSYYEVLGNERATIYSIEGIEQTYGFRPQIDVRTMRSLIKSNAASA